MVPLVDGVVDVQPLVALQAYQWSIKSCGQGAGDFGLAHAGLSLQEQGALQPHGQEYGNGQGAVGDVTLPAQQLLYAFDGIGGGGGGSQGMALQW